MCDCRINASKWDLSVLHEGAAALQLSENFCSEGHRQSLDTVQFFENFYSLWGFCFWFYFLVAVVCLFWVFFLPSSSFLSLSVTVSFFVSFLFWQSSATDHIFIRSEPFCSEMAYLYWSQQTDCTAVLRTKLQFSTHKGWFRRRRRKWKHSCSRSLEEDCFLLWYAFIILKRSLEDWIEALQIKWGCHK